MRFEREKKAPKSNSFLKPTTDRISGDFCFHFLSFCIFFFFKERDFTKQQHYSKTKIYQRSKVISRLFELKIS